VRISVQLIVPAQPPGDAEGWRTPRIRPNVNQLTKLEASSLREQAARAIRAMIIIGAIEPGEIHSAPSLGARLGVSATPIREAMLDLVSEGLVEAVRNRGFRVVELSERDLDEIFEARVLLEVSTLGRVAGSLSPEDAQRFLALVEEIEAFAADGDLAGFLDADRRFHLGLLEQLGNRRLVDLVDRLRLQSRLFGLGGLVRSGTLSRSAAEHREILEAVVAGDRRRVEQLMRRHLRHTRGIWAGLEE
jgi:DNA-binding GntR family transcriptional regulator